MSVLIGNNDLGDRIIASDESDSIFGLGGNDTIEAGGGDDVVFGGDGNDIISGDPGDDVLKGEGGNDVIIGGAGDDQLFGGAGADTLTGGADSDLFIFDFADAGLVDEVTDFTSGEDKILIQGAGSQSTVEYDPQTGILSVNGQAFIKLDIGLSISDDDYFIT
ncbi:MAG: hypothetical protein WA885_01820 [Phormidesmis sp.]